LHKTVLYHIASSDFEIPYSRIGKLFEGHALDSRNYSIIEKKLPLEL